MTGQDAVNTAKAFDENLGIDGTILTKMDGDARGGAALSIKTVTVTILQKGSLEIYQVHVAPEDMGKVIGRKGRIANAIRTVVKAGALRENRKVAVDII